ncbi:leucine-rich repeat serine/threonine-protein kinase 1 isoform X2 [Chrysoperla carnea]|uniref:leucine-rich repeat serine/threonine-protein kinase 1 isoform X2 n=1 Tax=Chrysoperla carnea TaxID=189513 RepID=UPI001D06E418|nr:leucine-rich repeat serine/threonine-protein kinase 1 isoform X2 [Chrysoperla carnea]
MLDSSPEDEDFPGRLLHQAALWDNAELLEDLLHGEQKCLLNSQDSWGRTPLHAAAITDNSRCLKILLEAGANPDIQCGPRGDNRTALHLSAEHGHKSNIETLLEHNASLVVRDSSGMTAFDIADKSSHVECMNILREAADGREKARQEVHASLREACCTGDVAAVRQLVASLGTDAELIINMAPSGANTLLFTASQVGRKEIVRVLLDHGADGRIHPVTKYSPLYIACYHGHKDIVEMLLKKFPELIQQHTVEKWLPIHACCINGHITVLELLFNFSYPVHLLRKFKDPTQQWEYYLAFDINEKDVTGQNILYVACLLGNQQMVEMLLKFRVKADRIKHGDDEDDVTTPTPESFTTLSPTRRRISDGIQSIMTRLNLRNDSENSDGINKTNESFLSPLNLDLYCQNDCETALHVAVKGKHYNIVSLLLLAGANPNLVIKVSNDLEESYRNTIGEEDVNNQQSTALVEASKNRDLPMIDLLLKYGSRDDDCKALCIAAKNRDSTLTARLLSIKAHPDPEYKINKKVMTENVVATTSKFSMFSQLTSLTYSSIFPNVPAMINWHNQKCHLSQIRPEWLIDAALHVNPKLKQNPRCHDIGLYAITRLDISNNSLTTLPLVVFQLCSLRYLNCAQNKIEKLPDSSQPSPHKKSSSFRSHRKRTKSNESKYDCPVLEEIYLQDNRLEYIPEALFKIPSLVTLVVSNNKLQYIPYEMWKAPKLKELNVSFNLLKELPTHPIEKITKELDTLSSSSQYDGASDSVDEPTSKKHASVRQIELIKHHVWTKSVEVTEQIFHSDDDLLEQSSKLSALNLAHNLFSSIPCSLPCLAVNLTRLNMSYNNLRSMSHITSYPNTLKQLDLSHNQITCWPSLPQVGEPSPTAATTYTIDSMEIANITCFSPPASTTSSTSSTTSSETTNLLGKLPVLTNDFTRRRNSGRSVRTAVLHSVCSHRRHLRLDNLRTLVLADNYLNRIQLTTDDDGDTINEDEESDWNMVNSGKSRLMFPNLSMLDVSNNNLKEIPHNIHELTNLSVLNISGNVDISELPPQMGLLSRLWNLNTRGCALQGPLKSMIDSKKFKTMDIVGYLKSVLEDAKPYARMKLMIVGVQGIGKTSLLEQLRQEGVGSYRKKPVEHWAKRMGNKNINVKTSRGTNMSTVGVDIGDWIYEKKSRGHSSLHGPVTFRTWDFGGQKEYYATHQYFLSKRSLYLVVWKISDGQKGIDEILQWLVNIQARAPNSPVLIVGTHYDLAQEYFPPHMSEDLQQIIRDRFINIVDAEKCGLPRVLDTIEVSCKTRHNIKLLCNLIYDTVFSLRPPGSKELLLEQRVPATYLALEDVVSHLATERRASGADPVLSAEQYKALVTQEMHLRYNRAFRDWAELHQATLFLHDNGVLLHYDDATLKDLYFLDPQWLCDMLAHVVTIREINPFARTGVMKLDDLKHIFKSSNIGPIDTRGYIVNLLNKFEVALTWDSRTLLIPSLLPSEEDMRNAQLYPGLGHSVVKVKVPLRSRGWAVRNKKLTISPKSMLYPNFDESKFTLNAPTPHLSTSGNQLNESEELTHQPGLSYRSEPDKSITRLLLMSYFPSGFWSRLISRILADDSIVDIVRSFFMVPKEVLQDVQLAKMLDVKAEWVLWQTGLQLKYGDITLFRMKEVLHSIPAYYRHLRFKLKQDGVWCDVDLINSSILELYFPIETLLIKQTDQKIITIEPNPESTAQLLSLAVDHIDVLLEDWYPTLGTRFVHTSEGKFLVTRLVPCPKCLSNVSTDVTDNNSDPNLLFPPGGGHLPTSRNLSEAFKRAEVDHNYYEQRNKQQPRVRKSQESYTSECDSGVGPDSTGSSRMPSVEGHPGVLGASGSMADEQTNSIVYYSWMIEECILEAYGKKLINCPAHGDIPLSKIAPDTIFMDLGERHLIRPENIKKGRLLGRGAFGFVFKGTCRMRGSNTTVEVAMKMLQPVQPGQNARQSAIIAYKAAQGKWDRDPLQYACKAYCTARQELNILLALRHPNIVPLVGVCISPLALVLDLAPQGALDTVLRHFRRSGARIGPYTLQAIILQVARAIEYLHRQRIIYRDLKSENVLVWEMPPPFQDHPDNVVHIKVADYGISRLTLPSGTKGFGGTEGFMAPEIMRYNGEEEYTEKVDCFSFGMFIYELLTLHQPFEGHESVKECILEGGRPPLTYRETLYPSYSLDLMVLCWSQQPRDRPSASQIVSIASAPEFTHLCDVVSLNHSAPVMATTSIPITHITDDGLNGSEMWLLCANGRADLLLSTSQGWLQHNCLPLPNRPSSACTVGPTIWIGDCLGNVHAYVAGDGTKLFTYKLEPDLSVPNSVIALLYLPTLQRVACALANGRLFLVTSETAPSTPTAGEGSFVMTELGSSTSLYSLCTISKDSGRIVEIWCGESGGRISIYTMKDQVVSSHETINHFDPIVEGVNVLQLISSNNTTVWSYVYPGCTVYQWDSESRTIINKLDCSKLVPCSESLKSISIEEHLSPGKCQVTCMAIVDNEIYIGTTWGCIIIAEQSTMRPITIFRPFEEEVRSIVPLMSVSRNPNIKESSYIATIGRGYRSLISRYTDIPFTPSSLQSPMMAATSTITGNSTPLLATTPTNEIRINNIYALLWRAEHWASS